MPAGGRWKRYRCLPVAASGSCRSVTAAVELNRTTAHLEVTEQGHEISAMCKRWLGSDALQPLLAQNGFALGRHSRRRGDDVEHLVEDLRRHLLYPPRAAGACIYAAQ